MEIGLEGSGLISIEHHELKAGDQAKRRAYTNCLLSCRFCNSGRKTMPATSPEGERLLDPTKIAWATVFKVENSVMEVVGTSPDAKYTYRAYDLGDERKASLRRGRASRFEAVERARREAAEYVPFLLEEAERTEDPVKKRKLVDGARIFEDAIVRAVEGVQRYASVPNDAPRKCRCSIETSLPSWLDGQLQEIA
ncbi:MAG: hypothetical protein H6716_17215 [Polyangiaceae bacterium]|nr:hypothetical protein [Polyangiaceae bacterium]